VRIKYLFRVQWIKNVPVEPLFFDLKNIGFEMKKRTMQSFTIDQVFKKLYLKNPEIFEKGTRSEKENFNDVIMDIFEYVVVYFISMRFMTGFSSGLENSVEDVSVSLGDLPIDLKEKNKVFIYLAKEFEPDAFVPTFSLPKSSKIYYSRADGSHSSDRKFLIKNDRGDINITIKPRHFSFFDEEHPIFVLALLFEFKSKYFFGSRKNQDFVYWVEGLFTEIENGFAT
jgi:hypothetical protein